MKVSWFKNGFSEVSEDLTVVEIAAKISSNEFQKRIEACHQIVKKHGKKHPDYDVRKKKLPFFTPSGTFEKNRRSENLKEYSGMMMLDIDDLENEFEVLEIKNAAKQCPYTWMTFVSPSGIGLKIWVKVASTNFEHSIAYQKLLALYENFLRIPVDKSTTDLARACFISYDSNYYLNEESDIFDFRTAQLLNSPRQINAKYMEDTIKFCIELTQRVVEFEEGNRNNFVFRLACNMNRYGVPEGRVLEVLLSNYSGVNFSEKVIESTVKSAYGHKHEHGKYSYKGKSIKTSVQSFDRAKRALIYQELGIDLEKIMDEIQFAKTLLHAHLMDDTGESLLDFACEKLEDLLTGLMDSTSKQILEMLLLKEKAEKSNFINHSSAEVRNLTSEVVSKSWQPAQVYICRIEIYRFKISKCAEVLQRAAFQSRFLTQLKIGQSLRNLEALHFSREKWMKELEALLQDWEIHRY